MPTAPCGWLEAILALTPPRSFWMVQAPTSATLPRALRMRWQTSAANAPGGRFIIRNGRDFATVGALSNNGTISVGNATILDIPGGFNNSCHLAR